MFRRRYVDTFFYLSSSLKAGWLSMLPFLVISIKVKVWLLFGNSLYNATPDNSGRDSDDDDDDVDDGTATGSLLSLLLLQPLLPYHAPV